MMTDDAALRAAILDAPQDDAPRLVYADWLDENGQPERAEFIRVQCALARIDEESDPVRYDLEKRQAALLKKHQRQWLAPYKLRPDDVEFRRGFVGKLTDASRRRPVQLDALLANEPLCELEWNTVEDHTERLLRSPRMEHVTHLDCSSVSLDETQIEYLLDFPRWKSVRALNLGWCSVPTERIKELFRTRLPLVDEIDLCGIDGLTIDGRKELLQALTTFRKVSFGYTGLSDRGLAELGKHTYPRLEFLDIGAEDITLEGFLRFLKKAKMPALKTLRVFANNLTNDGAQAFADGHPWPLLEELDAGNTGFSMTAAKAIAKSPHFPNLRRLHVGNELNQFPNRIGNLGLKALANSTTLPNLRELDVLFNGITAKGIGYLCKGPLLGQLWKLDLNNNHIGDEGAILLAQCPAIANLRMVGLLDCNIGDVGAEALLKSKYWSKKVKLNLRQNTISDALMKKIERRFALVPTTRFACSFAAP